MFSLLLRPAFNISGGQGSLCSSLSLFAQMISSLRAWAVIALLGLPFVANPAYAGNRAEALGLQLVQLAQQGDGGDLLPLAQKRRDAMVRLMMDDPALALRAAMPAEQRNRLPGRVANLVEETRIVEGRVKVLVHDFDDHFRVEHRLQTLDGDIGLHFAGKAPELKTGQLLRVRGLQLAREMVVDGDDEPEVLYLNGDNATTSSSSAELSDTFGEQRVLVLLVNYQNDSGNQPFTVQQAQDMIFGQVDGYFREVSSGRTWLSGDVFGWYTMSIDQPVNSADCSLIDIAAAAKQAASSAGVNVSAYDRLVYAFPQTNCFASGTATVGGAPSEAWINGDYFELGIIGHEMGHNFGLKHSGSQDCGSAVEGGACSPSPYGDPMDIMGNVSSGHFNARHKERLGWLDAAAGEIVEVNDGTYTLAPYELQNGAGVQALKVFSSLDSASGAEIWYYIEYRQPLGQDGFLAEGGFANYGNIYEGVVIRQVTTPSSIPVTSLLLDMTPDSTFFDSYDSALLPGQSYTDPRSGVTITTDSADSNGAIVTIDQSGGEGCVRQQPEMKLLSSQSQWASAGDTLQYQLEVVSHDSSGCPGSSINLDATMPEGWNVLLSSSDIVLSAGSSTAISATVTSASSAQAGAYDVEILLNSDTGYSNSAVLAYVVESAGNTAPVAVDDSVVMASVSAITIDVLGNDWDPEGDALAVTGVGQPGKGSVIINGDGSITYTPGKRFKNSDSFSYTISDGTTTATASVSVSSQSSGGGGKNSGGGGKGRK